jgi:hypothetical protein
MKRSHKLSLEPLESRLAPATFGVPWPDPTQITISFVPDGTATTDGRHSELFAWLGESYGSLDWQGEILRAAQTWAEQANLNIVLVEDSGLPLGTAGAIQGDSRFGDIRIAAYPMSGEVLAIGSPFDPLGGTFSGDLKFNTRSAPAASTCTPSRCTSWGMPWAWSTATIRSRSCTRTISRAKGCIRRTSTPCSPCTASAWPTSSTSGRTTTRL